LYIVCSISSAWRARALAAEAAAFQQSMATGDPGPEA
jgi:hypothetical protein